MAIIHDHLLEFGGAERVLVALKRIFPEADVYTSLINFDRLGEHAQEITSWNVRTSWAQQVPGFRRLFSPLRFLWPLIWESFDFSDYDIVLSSSGTMMCKGVITRPETPHICYLHHPPRNLYGYETAIEWQKHLPVRLYGHLVNHELRMWDYLSSQRVDHFIANSEETVSRIKKFYRMEASVIYPPVTIPKDAPQRAESPQYYLTISRIAKAKHIEVLIEAANKKKFPLKIVGNGRDLDYLKSIAGTTVEFLDHVPDAQFEELFTNAKAFLFAARDEEFGIAPVEAMGRGVPVIAYTSGGPKETVTDGHNGFVFPELNADSLLSKIAQLEELDTKQYQILSQNARKEAEKYSFEQFKRQIQRYITQVQNPNKDSDDTES